MLKLAVTVSTKTELRQLNFILADTIANRTFAANKSRSQSQIVVAF